MKNLSSQERIKLMEARFLVEQQYEWNKWTKEIPSLKFKKKWNVKIIPPCTGAIIRFRVTYKNRWVSVYLDCYDELGFFGEPYWEIYPYEDDVYRVPMYNTNELIERINDVLTSKDSRVTFVQWVKQRLKMI